MPALRSEVSVLAADRLMEITVSFQHGQETSRATVTMRKMSNGKWTNVEGVLFTGYAGVAETVNLYIPKADQSAIHASMPSRLMTFASTLLIDAGTLGIDSVGIDVFAPTVPPPLVIEEDPV